MAWYRTLLSAFSICGALVKVEEPTLTYNYQPKSLIYIIFSLDIAFYMGLGKCVMTCIHHYGTRNKSFTSLNICALPNSAPLLSSLNLENHALLLSPESCFYRVSHNCDNTACSPFQIGFLYLLIIN